MILLLRRWGRGPLSVYSKLGGSELMELIEFFFSFLFLRVGLLLNSLWGVCIFRPNIEMNGNDWATSCPQHFSHSTTSAAGFAVLSDMQATACRVIGATAKCAGGQGCINSIEQINQPDGWFREYRKLRGWQATAATVWYRRYDENTPLFGGSRRLCFSHLFCSYDYSEKPITN